MHSARPYGPAGLLSPWTVRPLDVRNPLGAALSSARTALTRMFFDACTRHRVPCAAREARRSLPRPWSSASSPVGLHGGNERLRVRSTALFTFYTSRYWCTYPSRASYVSASQKATRHTIFLHESIRLAEICRLGTTSKKCHIFHCARCSRHAKTALHERARARIAPSDAPWASPTPSPHMRCGRRPLARSSAACRRGSACRTGRRCGRRGRRRSREAEPRACGPRAQEKLSGISLQHQASKTAHCRSPRRRDGTCACHRLQAAGAGGRGQDAGFRTIARSRHLRMSRVHVCYGRMGMVLGQTNGQKRLQKSARVRVGDARQRLT